MTRGAIYICYTVPILLIVLGVILSSMFQSSHSSSILPALRLQTIFEYLVDIVKKNLLAMVNKGVASLAQRLYSAAILSIMERFRSASSRNVGLGDLGMSLQEKLRLRQPGPAMSSAQLQIEWPYTYGDSSDESMSKISGSLRHIFNGLECLLYVLSALIFAIYQAIATLPPVVWFLVFLDELEDDIRWLYRTTRSQSQNCCSAAVTPQSSTTAGTVIYHLLDNDHISVAWGHSGQNGGGSDPPVDDVAYFDT